MDFTVDVIRSPEEAGPVRVLFKEYAASLGIDLGFSIFRKNWITFPGIIVRPQAYCFWRGRAGRRPAALRSTGCLQIQGN